VRSEGADVLSSMSVSLNTSKTTFSASVDKTGRIYVEGCVRGGVAYISKIGAFDVELRSVVWRHGSAQCLAGALAAGHAAWAGLTGALVIVRRLGMLVRCLHVNTFRLHGVRAALVALPASGGVNQWRYMRARPLCIRGSRGISLLV
jgi:hypothetical protein